MKTSPHKSLLVATLSLCLLASAAPVRGTNPPKAADSVIAEYHSDDPAASVRVWQAQMTRPSGNPRFHEFQKERLGEGQQTEVAPHPLAHPPATTPLLEIIKP